MRMAGYEIHAAGRNMVDSTRNKESVQTIFHALC